MKIELKEGIYHIDATSSSSMFRITDCDLIVAADGKMQAEITLSGKGYGKLYMGKAEDAEKADESEYIYYKENSGGEYTYTLPIKELDKEIDCAAWSIKKERWYDRTLVFESKLIPQDAYKNQINPLFIVIPAVIALAACVCIFAVKRINKKREKSDK